MGLQASASRTGLLLECQRPFGPEVEVDYELPREPARYGSAFHSVMGDCLEPYVRQNDFTRKNYTLPASGRYAKLVDAAAKAWDVIPSASELAGHVKGSFKVLTNWLTREKLDIVLVEKAYAFKPVTCSARSIPPHDEAHQYAVDHTREIPGTVDLVAASDRRRVVIDHKTGGEDHFFAQPAKLPQMRTLALAVRANEVGIFHADRRGLPMLYAEELDKPVAEKHTSALAAAMGRIGDGSLRPGPWCGRCPAHDTCPAKSADILSEASAALVRNATALADEPANPITTLATSGTLVVEARAAAIYDLLKRFRAVEKAGSEEIKRLVKSGLIIETREGVLEFDEQSFEALSKKSLLEALGKVKGERMLKQLREKGAMKTITRQVLVTRK